MPPGKTQRKVRPSTASGLLQSHEVANLFDEIRPVTAPGKNLFGLEPTFVTSRHHVPGSGMPSHVMGRQVHGGLPTSDLKGLQGRRATLGGLEDVADREKPLRPSTAVSAGQQIKVGNFELVFLTNPPSLRMLVTIFGCVNFANVQCFYLSIIQ